MRSIPHLVSTIVLSAGLLSACTGSQEQTSRAEIEAIVKEYILANPRVISQSLQRLQESSIAAEITRAAGQGILPIIGNPEAPITLIEFMDYNCGYCRRAAKWVKGTIGEEDNPGDVRLIIVEFPVLDSRTGTSKNAALAAIAAGFQNKYRQMHDALITAPDLSTDAITRIAGGIGLNVEKLRADMSGQQANDILDEAARFAEYAGITGTPGFFLNGQRVVGFDKKRLNTLLTDARS